MNEVEKMYNNVNIKPTHYDACKIADAYWLNEELANEYGTFDNYMKLNCPYKYQECTDECKHAFDKDTYPPFTAEKQLELIKWLSKFNLQIEQPDYSKDYFIETHTGSFSKFMPIFEEALAGLINNLWQDLTDAEKAQIKNILESEVRE